MKAGRREWIGLTAIALPCVLYAMDLTVLNLALPQISAELHPTSSEQLWIVDIYGFLVAGMLVTMGNVGDRIGRRRLLLIGAVVFGAGSVAAACATSAAQLIVARAVLGVAGATVAPSTLSLIRNMFHDARQRTLAIGIWTTSFSVGGALGPLLGGAVLQRFSWGAVFLLAPPVMALLLVVGPRLLPEYRDPAAEPLDLVSAALSIVAVLSAIYGLKVWAREGVSWRPFAAIAAGLLVGAVFVRRQRGLATPLIDLRLFRARPFRVALAAFTLTTLIVFGYYVLMAQYLQLVLGLEPLAAGLWMLPGSIAVASGSLLAPALVRRAPAAHVIGAGLAVAALGFALLVRVGALGLPGFVVGATLIFAGIGPLFTLGTDLIVGAAPPERAGAASAISETSSELGGALGIAVLGSLGGAIYRASLGADAPAAARETLGGALAAAQQLADPAPLVDAARAAFVRAMEVTAAISLAVAIAVAVMAFVALRPQSTP